MATIGKREYAIFENKDSSKYCKPSETKHVWKVHYTLEETSPKPDILGKWMVFRHYDEIDETWEEIRTAIARNELQGCVRAKCSTMRYNPTHEGPGPSTTAVICVLTEEHNKDAIGFKLIQIAKNDIKYKPDAYTRDGMFSHTVSDRVTTETIYWNRGRPSFQSQFKCFGTSLRREDIWHLNVVIALEPNGREEVHSRWILYLENDDLTELWHRIKDMVESKERNFGIIKMVCPPKRVRNSPDEQPVFHVYTSSRNSRSVGKKLIEFTESDIDYEHKPPAFVETLYWNDGEPDYERIRRKLTPAT